MTTSAAQHRRTLSGSSNASRPPRSPSPPTQTYHSSILPRSVPTPALVESVAGAAHYSGIRVDPVSAGKHRRRSSDHHKSHVDVKADHHRVMADLRELYGCRPTLEILQRSWHKDAVFEDPWCACKGFDEYAAQWFAMPKLFSNSETVSMRVMSSTHLPNRLVFSQTQEYTTRLLKRKKTVQSIVVVELDDDDKIVRLVDQWDGKDLPTKYGAHLLRVISAKLVPWLIHVPKHSI